MGTGGQCRIRLRIDATPRYCTSCAGSCCASRGGPAGPAHDLAASDKTPFSRFPALPVAPGRQIVDERAARAGSHRRSWRPGQIPPRRDRSRRGVPVAARGRRRSAGGADPCLQGPAPCRPSKPHCGAAFTPCTSSATAAMRKNAGRHCSWQARTTRSIRPTPAICSPCWLAWPARRDNAVRHRFSLGSCQTAETSPADASAAWVVALAGRHPGGGSHAGFRLDRPATGPPLPHLLQPTHAARRGWIWPRNQARAL